MLGSTSVLFFGPTRAIAQTYQSSLDQLREELPSVFSGNLRFQADERTIDSFLQEELVARQNFFENLSDLNTSELFTQLDPAAQQLDLNQDELANVIVPANDVRGIKILRDIPARENDSQTEVVLDIIIGTLGLEVFREALVELAKGDNVFAQNLADMSEALQVRDFDTAQEHLITIVIWITSQAGLRAIQSVLTTLSLSEIRLQLLFKLGARLVPYVGWGFTGMCFASCVYAYRNRLRAVFQ